MYDATLEPADVAGASEDRGRPAMSLEHFEQRLCAKVRDGLLKTFRE